MKAEVRSIILHPKKKDLFICSINILFSPVLPTPLVHTTISSCQEYPCCLPASAMVPLLILSRSSIMIFYFYVNYVMVSLLKLHQWLPVAFIVKSNLLAWSTGSCQTLHPHILLALSLPTETGPFLAYSEFFPHLRAFALSVSPAEHSSSGSHVAGSSPSS